MTCLESRGPTRSPRKSKRPFAAGIFAAGRVRDGALLLAVAVIIAAFSAREILARAGYLLCAHLRLLLWPEGTGIIDAPALAGLYTLRIIGGGGRGQRSSIVLVGCCSRVPVPESRLCEALRELDALRRAAAVCALQARGYHVEDLSLLQSLGTSAGYLSVLVLALYIIRRNRSALHPAEIHLTLSC